MVLIKSAAVGLRPFIWVLDGAIPSHLWSLPFEGLPLTLSIFSYSN
jgi:hypothetical protein